MKTFFDYILMGLISNEELLRVKLSTQQGSDQKEFKREEDTTFIQFRQKKIFSQLVVL